MSARRLEIVEVAPRDGLQNGPSLVATADKIVLIARAVAAGVKRIEVASFVRPDRVPQMADAEAVIAGLDLPDDVVTIGATTLDASLEGIGGCPFAPNATGNIATEGLLYMLDRSGVETALDVARVIDGSLAGGHHAQGPARAGEPRRAISPSSGIIRTTYGISSWR